MNNWTPITYCELWDVPRIFLVTWHGRTVLFDCAFDEDTEDYPDFYRVYILPPLSAEELAGSWADFYQKAIEEVGVVPIKNVVFDPTRRTAIDATLLDELLTPIESRGEVIP
jgi:hypothetical protein